MRIVFEDQENPVTDNEKVMVLLNDQIHYLTPWICNEITRPFKPNDRLY